jgi:hypothetical protein
MARETFPDLKSADIVPVGSAYLPDTFDPQPITLVAIQIERQPIRNERKIDLLIVFLHEGKPPIISCQNRNGNSMLPTTAADSRRFVEMEIKFLAMRGLLRGGHGEC